MPAQFRWQTRRHACKMGSQTSRHLQTKHNHMLFGGCRPATLSQDERLKKLEATLDKLAQKSFRWQEARGGWEALPLMLHLSEGS